MSLGATPVTYGPGLADRLAGRRGDAVLDCAGSGSLPDLVALAGGPERVVTIADPQAREYGVHVRGKIVFKHRAASDPGDRRPG